MDNSSMINSTIDITRNKMKLFELANAANEYRSIIPISSSFFLYFLHFKPLVLA